MLFLFFFQQKTAYEMRSSDWSSDVCSSDLERKSATRRPKTDRIAQHVARIHVRRDAVEIQILVKQKIGGPERILHSPKRDGTPIYRVNADIGAIEPDILFAETAAKRLGQIGRAHV